MDINWSQLGMDITDYGGRYFLTLINCGPSYSTPGLTVIWQLEAVLVRNEIPTNNDAAITCLSIWNFLKDWDVWLGLICLHPSWIWNCGEMPQNHKNHCSQEAVYWHNETPKDNVLSSSALTDTIHKYHQQDWCCSPTQTTGWTRDVQGEGSWLGHGLEKM